MPNSEFDKIRLDDITEIILRKVGGENNEEDNVWDFACFADTARDVFKTHLVLSNLQDKCHKFYLDYKYRLMRLYDRGNLYLIERKLSGECLKDEIVCNIGIVAIVPDAVEHRGEKLTYLKYFGLVNEAQGQKIGKRVLAEILKKYPKCIVHVEYPQNDAMDKVVEFYYNAGFGTRLNIVKDDNKYLMMSTVRIVTLDEYLANSANMYPVVKDLEDKLQEI